MGRRGRAENVAFALSFWPASAEPSIVSARVEYEGLWAAHGNEIVARLEAHTGLRFADPISSDRRIDDPAAWDRLRRVTKLVTMTAEGRVTIPATARKELGVEGETQFEVQIESEAIVLRPAVVLPREDAWAYTPEHRRLLATAHRDSREGRIRRLSEARLSRLKKK